MDATTTLLGSTTENPIPPAELVDALNTLGVFFLQGDVGVARRIGPAALLTALASSPEARLRMALIPLLLAHPEFAPEARAIALSLPAHQAIVLRCYYTAAYWLRAKYGNRLEAVCGPQPALPDLFGKELGIPEQSTPDNALHALAKHQQEQLGVSLNWLGTYEHAAQNWLRFYEQEKRWQQSHPIKSTDS